MPPPRAGLSWTYLDDVIGEGIPKHPVQGDALILQDVLLGAESQTCALQSPGGGAQGSYCLQLAEQDKALDLR